MAESGIYEIVNIVNGKRYAGSAVCLNRRWKEHLRLLHRGCHHSTALQNAWNKYGAGSFEFRVIEACDPSDLIMREQAQIDAGTDYNICAVAGSTLGLPCSAETRKKIGRANKGRLKGIKQSPEQVEARAASHRGKKRSEETRCKIAEKAKGRPFIRHNDDYREKLSAAAKGRKLAPEHMAAFQVGRANHIQTEEQKAKISASLKQQYADGSRSRERSPEYREKIAATLRERSKATDIKDRLRKQAIDAWAARSQDEREQHMKKVRAARSK